MKKKFLFVVSLFAAALFTVAMAQAPQQGKCGKARTECCQKAACDDCACAEECKKAACADCKEACCEKKECAAKPCADKPCAKEGKACKGKAVGCDKALAKPCCRRIAPGRSGPLSGLSVSTKGARKFRAPFVVSFPVRAVCRAVFPRTAWVGPELPSGPVARPFGRRLDRQEP